MKKVLLLALFGLSLSSYAQTIYSENFTALPAGNVATDPTATTPGASGYYILEGTATDYQITTIDAAHGNSLQVKSGNSYVASPGTNTSSHFVIKPFTAVSASTGNSYILGTVEFFTGPATTGFGKLQFAVYNAAGGIVGITYDFNTKKIGGMGKLQPATGAAAFYTIGLSNTATYPPNTWVTASFSYNSTTGDFIWSTPEGNFTFTNTAYSKIPGLTGVNQIAYGNTTAAGNTVVNTGAFDNVNVNYTGALAVDDLIVTGEIEGIAKVYPNPTSDFINIKSDSKINSVSVVDLTGRKMNTPLNDNKVDVRNLPNGTYIINIETKNGNTSEKFIKQ